MVVCDPLVVVVVVVVGEVATAAATATVGAVSRFTSSRAHIFAHSNCQKRQMKAPNHGFFDLFGPKKSEQTLQRDLDFILDLLLEALATKMKCKMAPDGFEWVCEMSKFGGG